MNKQNRKVIEGYINSLEDIKQNIESMLEDEETKFDNMPEGLQESERGEALQNAIDNLDSAISAIEEAVEYIENI